MDDKPFAAKVAEDARNQGQRVEPALGKVAAQQNAPPDHMVVLMDKSVEKIWSRNNLLQSSYLDEAMYFFEQKAIIIERWIVNYYKNVNVTYTLKKHDKPPFYRMIVSETSHGDHEKAFEGQFTEFNRDMLELTKARGGQGVKDILEIFKSATVGQVEQQRLSLIERGRQWLGGNTRL